MISEGTDLKSSKVIGKARVGSRGILKGEVVHFHDAMRSVKAAVERAAAMAGVKVVSLFATLGCGGDRGLNRSVGGKAGVGSPRNNRIPRSCG